MNVYIWFVVSTPLEKYSSMGGIIQYILENKKCLKPPTRYSEEPGGGRAAGTTTTTTTL